MLSVPEPLPNDPEAVVTALETAEIFGKQGDLKEAVRWVRRAAEIAAAIPPGVAPITTTS